MLDKVFINDLVIDMFAGIYAHEKAKKQRVIINITLDVESNAGKNLSSIDDVVSYENIVNEVKALSAEKHYDLLEEFAENIANTCLKHSKIKGVSVRLEKPDIISDTKSVGIEITR